MQPLPQYQQFYQENQGDGQIKSGKRRKDEIFPQYASGTPNSSHLANIGSQIASGVPGYGYPQRQQDVRALLHQPDPNSTLFLPEQQRFDKDYALYDKFLREQELRKKEMIQEKHRIEALERESRRWEQIENQSQLERQKREYQSTVLLAGKRNSNGLPYNPITLEYDRTEAGQKLKARDDDAKVRAYVRAQNLDTRSNCGYNLLTGEHRTGVEVLVPQFMKDKYSEKLRQKDEFYSIKYRPEDL